MPATACERREPTSDTGHGPHDYSLGVASSELWRSGDEGEPLFLQARVLDVCGAPVADARVLVVHANHHGAHEADRWRAELRSDGAGAFELLTVYPGHTGGIPRHIHFEITHPEHRTLATRLFFKNDPTAGEELGELALVVEEVRRTQGRGWLAGYEFVLAPR